jgi:DNA polymerase-3 subunit delta
MENLYLVFGEERFMAKHHAAKIEKSVSGEKTVFDGVVPVQEIIMAAETLPFFGVENEQRLIEVRDSGLFTAERKTEAEALVEYLPKIPADTVLVFIETEVDRRGRLYKKAAEHGKIIDSAPLPQNEMVKWLVKRAKKHGKSISPATANALIRTCGTNMANLANESDKLFAYSGAEATPADIAEICTPTLEARIFDLTKAVGAGNIKTALNNYQTMLTLKESPFMILTMIIRQLRIILLCKCHSEKNTPRADIAKELKIQDFVISEALSHSRRFTTGQLISALKSCQSTDVKMKTGLITPETGVELLIIEITGNA